MALARLQPQTNRPESDEAARRLARDGPKEVQHEVPLPVAVGLTPERHPTLWLAMNPAHTRCPVGTRSVGPCNGPPDPPGVRMVRQTSPNGRVRVLATNLDSAGFPAALFGDLHHLHHPRWRIKEAFKRQKHRLKLESVSGLSQQALIIDVAAKVRTGNIRSLMCTAASAQAAHATHSRKCNRAYAATVMQRFLPGLVLVLGNAATAISDVLAMLGAT